MTVIASHGKVLSVRAKQSAFNLMSDCFTFSHIAKPSVRNDGKRKAMTIGHFWCLRFNKLEFSLLCLLLRKK